MDIPAAWAHEKLKIPQAEEGEKVLSVKETSVPQPPAPLTAQATLAAAQRADLTVSKAICPATVTESGQLTYTFVLQNFGNTAATAGDNVILTDTFDPALTGLTVTYNGDAWTEGDNYTYDAATGTFATIAGQITVPAATYTQETDGTYTVTPGTTTVTVTGTV